MSRTQTARTSVPRVSRPASRLRLDATLLGHGRAGTERVLAAALLLDGVRSRHLAVPDGRVVLVAGPARSASPPLLADLRARVAAEPGRSIATWIDRAATFAPHRIAAELVAAGAAAPLSPRFQRKFTLSIDAHAEADARTRVATDPALAVLLWHGGVSTGDPLPPSTHSLAPAERAILTALRELPSLRLSAA
jgi:hypothetical protein